MKKGFIPEKCILWKKHNIEESDMSMSNFDVIETLIDTSHLWRYVLKCKECGQLYFFEFKEDINWSGEGNGNDFQYSTWIPIPPDSTEELAEKSPLELLDPALTPRIQSDLTPYRCDEAHWVGKERVEFVQIVGYPRPPKEEEVESEITFIPTFIPAVDSKDDKKENNHDLHAKN